MAGLCFCLTHANLPAYHGRQRQQVLSALTDGQRRNPAVVGRVNVILQEQQGGRHPGTACAPALEHGDQPTGGDTFKLILYTKQGCPLCDGLHEKLGAVLDRAQFQPTVLSQARVEVRDIAANPTWEQAYALSVPVLAYASEEASQEVELPRPAPRLSTEALQRHLEKVLAQVMLSEGGR